MSEKKKAFRKCRNVGVRDYLIKSHFTPAEVIEKID